MSRRRALIGQEEAGGPVTIILDDFSAFSTGERTEGKEPSLISNGNVYDDRQQTFGGSTDPGLGPTVDASSTLGDSPRGMGINSGVSASKTTITISTTPASILNFLYAGGRAVDGTGTPATYSIRMPNSTTIQFYVNGAFKGAGTISGLSLTPGTTVALEYVPSSVLNVYVDDVLKLDWSVEEAILPSGGNYTGCGFSAMRISEFKVESI